MTTPTGSPPSEASAGNLLEAIAGLSQQVSVLQASVGDHGGLDALGKNGGKKGRGRGPGGGGGGGV
eukprot:531053-Lingulodinium_polyedra.AAC.1